MVFNEENEILTMNPVFIINTRMQNIAHGHCVH